MKTCPHCGFNPRSGELTEEKALAQSSGFIDMDGCIGYLPYRAAQYLVGTGKYYYQQSCSWGYVVKRK